MEIILRRTTCTKTLLEEKNIRIFMVSRTMMKMVHLYDKFIPKFYFIGQVVVRKSVQKLCIRRQNKKLVGIKTRSYIDDS